MAEHCRERNIFVKFRHVPPYGALNTAGIYKLCDFQSVAGYMWETVQDRAMVTMER